MESKISEVYAECLDISSYTISTHALFQYNTKCFPGIEILTAFNRMKEKLTKVFRVELNKKNKDSAEYYIDEDRILYIVKNNKIVTTYPEERVFKAKPIYSMKKSGRKWN